MTSVELGATLNIGGYSSVKVSVISEGATYEEAYDEARKQFYRAAHAHAREITVGMKSQNVVDFLASMLDSEPVEQK